MLDYQAVAQAERDALDALAPALSPLMPGARAVRQYNGPTTGREMSLRSRGTDVSVRQPSRSGSRAVVSRAAVAWRTTRFPQSAAGTAAA